MATDTSNTYAVEKEDGELIPVQNLATAQYLIENGVGTRILDLILNKYIK